MRAGRTTVNNRLLSRGYLADRPTKKPLLTANHRRRRLEWAQRWWNLTVAHWQHVIFGDESRFQLYPVDGRLRVRRLPGEPFRPGCQAHGVQAGGGSVHVWGAFHKFPLVLPDGYLTGVLYRGILQDARLIGSKLVVVRSTYGELSTNSLLCSPCSKYASTTSGDYRRQRREYLILTWHTQNETTRQRHEKNHLCSTIYHNFFQSLRYASAITHFIIKCRKTDKTQQNEKIGPNT